MADNLQTRLQKIVDDRAAIKSRLQCLAAERQTIAGTYYTDLTFYPTDIHCAVFWIDQYYVELTGHILNAQDRFRYLGKQLMAMRQRIVVTT